MSVFQEFIFRFLHRSSPKVAPLNAVFFLLSTTFLLILFTAAQSHAQDGLQEVIEQEVIKDESSSTDTLKMPSQKRKPLSISTEKKTISSPNISIQMGINSQKKKADLEIDNGANAAYAACRGLIGHGKLPQAQACFIGVIDAYPRSTAAEKSQASLQDLRSFERILGSRIQKKTPPAFPEGRLELVVTSTGFGIFAGSAPAMFLATQSNAPLFLSAAGGGGAVALGASFALGSYLIAEHFNLDYGQTKTLQSGIFWGTALGLAFSPWISELAGSPWNENSFLPPLDFERALPAIALTSTLTGLIGLTASVGATLLLDLSPAQVSMINTGAAVGIAVGFGLAPLTRLVGLKGAASTGLVTTASMALGLLGGWGMSQALHFDVWEVLLIDGITILGGGLSALIGLTVASLGTSGGALIGGMLFVVGTGASLGAATASVGWMRNNRGDELSRLGIQNFEPMFSPSSAVDLNGNLVPVMPLMAFRF